MRRRVISLMLLASIIAVPVTGRGEGGTGTAVTGRVLSTSNGLPVAGASVELDRNAGKVATTTTDPSGDFRFQNEPGGQYSVVVSAKGFVTTRQDVLVQSGQPQVSLQLAIAPTRGLREIAVVSTSAQTALQTSATINEHVSATNVQTQNYARIGDTLIGVPGVNTQTGSSVGDDLGVSIRGFDHTETATLLDGHQIGPIGAFGNGYDYQVSPFWGLSGVDVIFGSGATGIYGASTIAGAVNFRTIDPTEKPSGLITQGIGVNGKALTGVQFTGTIGKVAYAFSQGVQGTYGNFAPAYYLQNGLLGTDFTKANLNANTYVMTGNYLLRNTVGKIVYSLNPKTSVSFTVFSATSWDDKSGNGDNDFNPYPYTLYNAEQNIANNPVTKVRLPDGKVVKCHHTIAVLDNSPQGYSCLTAPQWAAVSTGPSGGGPGPWQAIRNQDYHARLQTLVGVNQIVADVFLDHYALDYNRSEAGGGYNTSIYDTNGILLGDEIASQKNDLAFGYYWQNQYQNGDAYPTVDIFGNLTNVQSNYATLQLSNSNEYVRDAYQFSDRFTAFGQFWLQQLVQTRSNSFNPRLSFIYRPTSADILRLTGGKANSVPDPSLLYAPPSFNTTPSNINPACGKNALNSIGSISNPTLVPETADDVELSYGHRFHGGLTASVDIYSTYEHNALQSGTLPLSALGQTTVPPTLIQEYLNRISQVCGTHPTKANLAVTTTYNAAAARYQGLQWAVTWNPTRNLLFDAEYDTQSAAFLGIPDTILQQNVNIINGSQIAGIPLHKATATLSYGNRGFNAQLIGNYIGTNNTYARPGFWFANANVSQSVGSLTLALSANNLFNSAAQRWGYFGYGLYVPENKYGTDTSAFQQGTEQFGLPYTQVFFTVSEHF